MKKVSKMDQVMKHIDTKCWERARSPAQKDVREQEILEVAKNLLFEYPFDKISLSVIAKGLSFTRANLYKYFQSKEDIYLALLADEIFQFAIRFQKLNEEFQGDISVDSFLNLWVPAFSAERHLLFLLSIAGCILEKNCSDEILLRSKTTILMTGKYLLPALIRFFPNKEETEYANILNILTITANGMYSFCGLNESQKQLLLDNGMGDMIHDFATDYRKLLADYLK